MQTIADTIDELLDKLMPAMVQFSKCVTKLKLKLSNKAKIVASRHVIAKLLQKEFQDHGMVFEISKCARDLGISHSAAVSRPNKLLVSRFRKSVTAFQKSRILLKYRDTLKSFLRDLLMRHALGDTKRAVFLNLQ